MECRTDSKKYCEVCEHIGYCDKANRCNGDCHLCDDYDCDNNPKHEKKIAGVVENIDTPAVLFDSVEAESVEETDDYVDEDDDHDDEDNEHMICYNCGEVILDDDYYNVNVCNETEIFCSNCYDDECFRCPDCAESYLNRDAGVEYRGSTICNSCSDNYYYCDSCERYYYYEDFDNDINCCYECAKERDTGVESYHESNYWSFIGECKRIWKGKWRGIGIELEIDRDDSDKETERCTVSNIRSIYGNLKFEYDGSLDYGFEIITHPHTVEEFYKIDWAAILQVCKDNAYVSHEATHCGLHIHFSRTMFGATEKQQANGISKLIKFFETFWDDIIKVSRRTESQANDYAAKYGVLDRNEVKRLAKNKGNGRYFAVNNANRDTVEIRIMRGTLNISTFLACVDFCITIVKNSKIISWSDSNEVTKWLKGIKPQTREYIRSRNAFLEVV